MTDTVYHQALERAEVICSLWPEVLGWRPEHDWTAHDEGEDEPHGKLMVSMLDEEE